MCPVSNVSLGVYSDLTSVPLPQLLAAGATVALGADDPLLFGSRLAGQYATMRAAHDLDDATLARLAEMSFTASRAPSDVVARPSATSPPGSPDPQRSEGAADRHGLVDERDAEALAHPVAHLAGEGEQLLGGGAAAVGEGEGVLGGQPHPLPRGRAGVALAVAGVLDQPTTTTPGAPGRSSPTRYLDADQAAAAARERPAVPQPEAAPSSLSAAWLIEQAGFGKGYAARPRGPVALSTKHTLALTNRGGATTEDLLALAREIRDGVRERFGVTLVNEPVTWSAAL